MPSTNTSHTLLLSQIHHLYASVVYTHKIQEKQADIYFRCHRRSQIAMIVLTTASGGAFLASLLNLVLSSSLAALAISFVSLLVSAINLTMKTFKYGEQMQKHRDAAAKIWNLRESYHSLMVDLQSEMITLAEGRERRDQLQKEASQIYENAPRTTDKACELAQNALHDDMESTYSDNEINQLLPISLRTTNKDSNEN